MKARIIVILMLVAILCVPMKSKAWFMDSMINDMTSVANNMVDQGGNMSTNMLQFMSKLSDDIGIMADRILTMADKIGEMADRIVATEELMSETMLQMQYAMANPDETSDTTALLTTSYDAIVSVSDVPEITIAGNPEQYLIYVSPTVSVDNESASALITSEDDLYTAWPALSDLAENNELYIAVKTVSGTSVSPRSNVIRIFLQ